MTQEEIIDMARKSDFEIHPDNLISFDGIDCTSELIAFAKLVAEKEREQILFAIKEVRGRSQEPVAWISTGPARMIHWTADKPAYGDDWVPLYTTPPQRKPLTDEEINDRARAEGAHNADFWLGVRFAESAHGIKE